MADAEAQRTPSVTARDASKAELTALADLMREARDGVQAARGGPLWTLSEAEPAPPDEALARLHAAQEAGVASCVLGLLDDHPVGYLLAEVRTLHDGRRILRVSELWVSPPAREVGVGEAMLDEAIGLGQRLGCAGIDALALPGDRETKNFFETAGLVARAILVYRSIGPEGRPT